MVPIVDANFNTPATSTLPVDRMNFGGPKGEVPSIPKSINMFLVNVCVFLEANETLLGFPLLVAFPGVLA